MCIVIKCLVVIKHLKSVKGNINFFSMNPEELNVNQVVQPQVVTSQQAVITEKKMRPSLFTLIPLIGYVLILLSSPALYLIGGIFSLGIFGEKSDLLLSNLLFYTFLSLLFSVIVIIVSYFYYSKIMRVILVVSIFLPVLFGWSFVSRFSALAKIEQNKKATLKDFDSDVNQVLNSVKSVSPFIFKFSCGGLDSKNNIPTYCFSPKLYSDKSGEISEEEMIVLKNSLSKLILVKDKYASRKETFGDSINPVMKITIHSQQSATSSYQKPTCLNNEYYDYSCSVTTEVTCVKENKSCN